eukprot:3663536-Pyramimonas_sp.AAC.1
MNQLAEDYDIRCATVGTDPWTHIYREFNSVADELTWEARRGRTGRWIDFVYLRQQRRCIRRIRGGWDGG